MVGVSPYLRYSAGFRNLGITTTGAEGRSCLKLVSPPVRPSMCPVVGVKCVKSLNNPTVGSCTRASIVYSVTSLVSFGTVFLPEPFGIVSYWALVISLVTLIVVVHRSAFRQHKLGIFVHWSRPDLLLKMRLSPQEKHIAMLCLTVATSIVLSISVRAMLP